MDGQKYIPNFALIDDKMLGEQQETRIEMPNMCPFEKKEKYFFLY